MRRFVLAFPRRMSHRPEYSSGPHLVVLAVRLRSFPLSLTSRARSKAGPLGSGKPIKRLYGEGGESACELSDRMADACRFSLFDDVGIGIVGLWCQHLARGWPLLGLDLPYDYGAGKQGTSSAIHAGAESN